MILIYNSGFERSEIIEKRDFEESIFTEQYIRALNLVEQFITNGSSDSVSGTLKIISFCGDRGAGKSSCMRTVINILQNSNNDDINKFLKKNNYECIINTSFEIIDVIDPSFFDTCHNVLELVLGTMYGKVISISKSNPAFDFTYTNSLMKDFQKVKSCIHTLHNTMDGMFDELQELDTLSASVELKIYIDSLINNYLKLINKQWLVIPIDDIDFNMENAYTMCEQIRKYLSSPKCIVLIGVKINQLRNAVSINIRNKINEKTLSKQNYLTDQDIEDMAKKFISKFVPVSYRINMPQLYNLSERNLKLIINPLECNKVLPLKDAIVDLIFNRTRYLFYNSKGELSPIIPDNLRDLISLVGLLVSMPVVNESHSQNEQLKINKRLFKSYFFNTWIVRLPADIATKIENLVKYGVGNTLNKKVVSILKESFGEFLERDYEDNDSADKKMTPSRSLIEGILYDGNFSYNVSVGDVFYLFRLIEMEHLNDNDANLIFILKSLYSIKLYEEYENITELEGMVYPDNDGDNNAGIYRIDERFIHTNSLQRLLCGGYFTYCPGDLLPKNKDLGFLDMRIIDGKKLYNLLSFISKEINTKTKGEKFDDAFYNKLKLAEFFILTTVRSVLSKNKEDIGKAIKEQRSNYIPFYLTKYNQNTGYYVFDILAPFYNITNIKFAYERFSKIVPGLYEFVVNNEDSLLGQIFKECEESREGMNYGFPPEMHRLLSDAVIRNAEVLSAVFENAVSKRGKKHDATDINSIGDFYSIIMNSNMATHPINAFDVKYCNNYKILFSFLKPLQKLVNEQNEEIKKLFISSDISDDIINKYTKKIKKPKITINKNKIVEQFVSPSIKIKMLQIPSTNNIIESIGGTTRPDRVRKKIKQINYFKNFSDEKLKEIIPDKDRAYSKDERNELIMKWVKNNTVK